MSILTRLRFRKDDPQRYLHVPRKDRLDDDGPWDLQGDDTAQDDETGDDTDFDRDEVRNRGEVLPPEALQ